RIGLNPASDKNFEQFAATRFSLESKTVARGLLRYRASALAHMSGDQGLECGAQNSRNCVAVMLVDTCVLDRNDGVDQIARELLVRNGLTVLDVDLAEDLVVSIQNHAGRFHLFEPVQTEAGGLVLQIAQTHRDINGEAAEDESRDCDRHVKLRPCVPPRPE